eukprot:gene35140-2510_t
MSGIPAAVSFTSFSVSGDGDAVEEILPAEPKVQRPPIESGSAGLSEVELALGDDRGERATAMHAPHCAAQPCAAGIAVPHAHAGGGHGADLA